MHYIQNTLLPPFYFTYGSCSLFVNKTTYAARVIFEEFCTVLTCILPASIEWQWKKYKEEITTHTFEATAEKVSKIGYLHIHHPLNFEIVKEDAPSVLLIGGDYSFPSTMLHLAKQAQKKGLRVFTLHLGGELNDKNFEVYQLLVKNALIQMNQRSEINFIVGHSAGGILPAALLGADRKDALRAFVIGARIKTFVDEKILLKTQIDQIDSNVQTKLNHLHAIIPERDWCVPQACMIAGTHSYSVDGSHLSALYGKEVKTKFDEFLMLPS